MIWDQALSSYQIKVYSIAHSTATSRTRKPCIPAELEILLVCRQIYAEVHQQLYSLGTFFFLAVDDLKKYANANRLSHIRSIDVGVLEWYVKSREGCGYYFPLKKMPALKSLDVTIHGVHQRQRQVTECLREHLKDKVLVLRTSALMSQRARVWDQGDEKKAQGYETWKEFLGFLRFEVSCAAGLKEKEKKFWIFMKRKSQLKFFF